MWVSWCYRAPESASFQKNTWDINETMGTFFISGFPHSLEHQIKGPFSFFECGKLWQSKLDIGKALFPFTPNFVKPEIKVKSFILKLKTAAVSNYPSRGFPQDVNCSWRDGERSRELKPRDAQVFFFSFLFLYPPDPFIKWFKLAHHQALSEGKKTGRQTLVVWFVCWMCATFLCMQQRWCSRWRRWRNKKTIMLMPLEFNL